MEGKFYYEYTYCGAARPCSGALRISARVKQRPPCAFSKYFRHKRRRNVLRYHAAPWHACGRYSRLLSPALGAYQKAFSKEGISSSAFHLLQ